MSTTLENDLDNCVINFDRKVLVTNLLNEYGGQLQEIAKTVIDFLSAEEKKGKKFEKYFMLRGLEQNSEDEVVSVVPEENLKQKEDQFKNVQSMLYSAEVAGGSKSPPTEFMPLKHISIELESLQVKDKNVSVQNGTSNIVTEEKQPPKKPNVLGTMFKKQETSAAAKKSPEKTSPKKSEPEKKPNALGAMFKKQEANAKNSPKKEADKKSSNTLGAMFKKQESNASKKSSEPKEVNKVSPTEPIKTEETPLKSTPTTKGGKQEKKTAAKKPTALKKTDIKKVKEEPNVSINLFDEESSSSDDEEALDALKRKVFSDGEEDKPSTSNKRRRIVDSEDEDTGPEVKVEKTEDAVEAMENEDVESLKSETFLDDDGFVVTKKVKVKTQVASKKTTKPTPVKIKKESPKSPTKTGASNKPGTGTAAAKKKQGSITSFFTKK